jgi:hypothetical protein
VVAHTDGHAISGAHVNGATRSNVAAHHDSHTVSGTHVDSAGKPNIVAHSDSHAISGAHSDSHVGADCDVCWLRGSALRRVHDAA